MVEYQATILTGEKRFEPVKYWVEQYPDGYWVECEFSRFGPMSKAEALMALRAINQ